VTEETAPGTPAARVRMARLDEVPVRTAYALMALRSEVFVVEQQCLYLDLDGQDLDDNVRHLWVEEAGEPVAALRLVLGDPARIGRVVTARRARGRGLAAELVRAAVTAACAERDVDIVLHAQSYLTGWYSRLGFAVDGEEFLDDGIPHTPMRRRRE
jgi:ElaA protein